MESPARCFQEPPNLAAEHLTPFPAGALLMTLWFMAPTKHAEQASCGNESGNESGKVFSFVKS